MPVPLLTPLLNIKNYLKFFSDIIIPPLACPRCKEKEKIIKHGHYSRQAIDENCGLFCILIQRFLCKICGKTFSFLPPFLVRYKVYCIQAVSPLIETYLTTSSSLFYIIHNKYPDSILSYHCFCSYLTTLVAKSKIIYQLVLKEFPQINHLEKSSQYPSLSESPSFLKKKVSKRGKELLKLYHLFLIMKFYLKAAWAKFPDKRYPPCSWLLLTNQILFLNNYSTIF